MRKNVVARRTRINFKGAIHHVYFRGNARQNIFLSAGDRVRFLESLADRIEFYSIRLYLYCLMPNHVHFLLETPMENLPRFMESLLTSYAVYFNRKHGRVGHLTQGRYHSPLVEGDEYLLKLSRYIHLNPVSSSGWRHRPLKERRLHLRQYRWSSYAAYAGLEEPQSFVDYRPVLNQVRQKSGKPCLQYRRFVESGLAVDDVAFRDVIHQSSLGIGSQEFLAQLEKRYRATALERVQHEDVAFRRTRRKLDPDTVIQNVCEHFGVDREALKQHRKNTWTRPVTAALLRKLSGLSQREIADHFGVTSGAAICQQLKRLRDSCPPHIRQSIEDLERKLNS